MKPKYCLLAGVKFIFALLLSFLLAAELSAQNKPAPAQIIADSLAQKRVGKQIESYIIATIKKTRQKEETAPLYFQLATLYSLRLDYPQAAKAHFLGLANCADDSLSAAFYLQLGRTYNRMGKIDSALIIVDKGLSYVEEYPNPAIEIEMRIIKGSTFFNAIREDLAFKQYDTAISLMGLYRDSSLYVPAMSNAASCLVRLKDYESAKKFYRKLIAGYSQNAQFIGQVYANVAVVLQNQNQIDSAEFYFMKAVPMLQSPDNIVFLGTVYFNLAGLYTTKEEYNRALEYVILAEPIFQKVQPNRLGFVYSTYANLYMKLGQEQKGLDSYLKALKYVEEYNEVEEGSEICAKLSEYYEEKGDLEKALFYFKKLSTYRDQFLEQAKLDAIEKYRVAFETGQKEKEITQLEELNKLKEDRLEAQARVQNFIIGISIGFLLISILIGILVMRFRISRLALTNKAELANLNNKLVLNRLSPHFVFNLLNSIQFYINTNDRKNAISYLNKFAVLLRKFLDSFSDDYHTLADEIALIEEYVTIELMLKNDSFSFILNVEEGVPTDISFPTMLLQPLVENAIKHGTTAPSPFVKLHIKNVPGGVLCVLEDNGTGMKARNEKHRSRGMELCEQRVDLLNHSKKNKYALIWANKTGEESGLKISLTIPS